MRKDCSTPPSATPRAPDGADGFVYSVGWDGKPIVRERVRWPIVEAMGTAYALYTVTGEAQYEAPVSEMVGLLHQVSDGLRKRILGGRSWTPTTK